MIRKFLLGGDKFMSDMHLRQHRFMYCDCEPFNKNKEQIPKIKKAGDSRYIFKKNWINFFLHMIWLMEIIRI